METNIYDYDLVTEFTKKYQRQSEAAPTVPYINELSPMRRVIRFKFSYPSFF